MAPKKDRKITKAIIAAAGYGTRFLPATKNQPKEMLPIIDKPIIHYLVEEAVNSGISDIILVTRAGNHIMEDYFDNHSELEHTLEETGKLDRLQIIRDIPQMANFIYVRQKKHLPYGNGSPLLAVKDLIDDDESVVFMFGDDVTITDNPKPVTKQLIDVFEKEKPSAVVAVQRVSDDQVHKYGTVRYKHPNEKNYEISEQVEKAPLGKNPSNMAVYGRYVLSYDFFEKILNTPTGIGGELWVTDVINGMAQDGKKILAPPIDGEWLTTGDPMSFIKTTLKMAMRRDDLSKEVLDFLQELKHNYTNEITH